MELLAAAYTFLGRSYKKREFDCFSLICEIYIQLGIPIPNRATTLSDMFYIGIEKHTLRQCPSRSNLLEKESGLFVLRKDFSDKPEEFHTGIYVQTSPETLTIMHNRISVILPSFISNRTEKGVISHNIPLTYLDIFIANWNRTILLKRGETVTYSLYI